MQVLKTHYHPEIKTLENKSIFLRLATRAITVQGNFILLRVCWEIKFGKKLAIGVSLK